MDVNKELAEKLKAREEENKKNLISMRIKMERKLRQSQDKETQALKEVAAPSRFARLAHGYAAGVITAR